MFRIIFRKKRFGVVERELGQITQMIGANDPKQNIFILAGGKAVGDNYMKINDNSR